MKITIVGAGYVGFSLSVLLSTKYSVNIVDIDHKKLNKIQKKTSPIKDDLIIDYIKNKKLDLNCKYDYKESYAESEYIIIATPTNYDHSTGKFNTKIVESVIKNIIKINSTANIIIKSTIPIGFTKSQRSLHNKENIYFSPEFLRETKSLYDNLYPSRIIIGGYDLNAINFVNILKSCSKINSNKIPCLYLDSDEAESIKLFSNTYLAMRIAFFNELDSFCEFNNLDAKNIIDGVSFDPRIGDYYNNPSFGYGGYCLPKDTKQLLNNYKKIPNKIIKSVVESNITRKKFILKSILNKKPKSVGIYRLAMKQGSDNFNESAIIDIIKGLNQNKIKMYIYEPFYDEKDILPVQKINDLKIFIEKSELIIANRITKEIEPFMSKVYSRDIYKVN